MAGSAWNPGGSVINVDSESTNISQRIVASAAQTLLTISAFTYVPNTGAITVYRGGQKLIKDHDYQETDSTHVTLLLSDVTEGEVFEVVGIIGATGANVVLAQAAADAAIAAAIEAKASALSVNPANLLHKVDNLSDVADATTARNNIGAAPIASPTFTGVVTVPQAYNASGANLKLQVGGTDRVTIGSQGIEAGSFKPGSIAADDFADGALIENAPVGIGYGPGAGGTVTQATSKSTAVTLNKPSGQITMNNASLASGATVAFLFQNSVIGAETDSLICSVVASSTTNQANYTLTWNVGNTGAYILLTNRSAGPLAEAVRIKFEVIKGANS